MLPKKLQDKLDTRKENYALRELGSPPLDGLGEVIDFSSNDYLGFSKNETVFLRASEILEEQNLKHNGATGSRLLSGNHKIYDLTEEYIAKIHGVEAALIFNSGYDANVGFFSCVPQRGDVILYDEFIHASIRDGIQMSHAKAYKFKHNDLEDLVSKLSHRAQSRSQVSTDQSEIYVVTESVFSMDGDSPDLKAMSDLCENYGAYFVVDEAHALGVFGSGLLDELALGPQVFARLVTFGKAMGCHGAAILGSYQLKSYLINFARSLIYTTGLPPHSVATILASYKQLTNVTPSAVEGLSDEVKKLNEIIQFFRKEIKIKKLQPYFIASDSAIQSAIISGNERVKAISRKLIESGFDVKAILSPTVPAGQERLRFCLHSYNTQSEIKSVLELLEEFLENLSAEKEK
ncbi:MULTISPECIES: aminotransferase class I/II-fold pyridoxal phosphate-dependent enzyme [unclassified Leeuwenhoekiella]|uniref:aminotransferase class I/II-fold pyridoxal phosphate-dependent enzyme n=1 Tax=unclassified Leeuwenhoekiella TaxID=2615029 RepID=UPI000C679217|nr:MULTISPECIES: aminotransferase class I/II-fold pyridoxal phosphate-dependent enzyme [unclassified Leeuwenhoekiella]MAW95780.1 8-amino-7-oxononanoate synthase [Leeuwenhoekiella sp.]MBA82949.1 8-amino-7-oxononanoate synthase [Leeuwenhoekiella sp.]|tara:strand:+ start:4752 stop:5966 length:1215 start_codon:yes stop_codon:yes gene_type:complete